VVVLALTGSADLRWGVEQLRRRFNPSPPQ
jgi:hypothetical protein